MAKVFAIWNGGPNYEFDRTQVEVFPSLQAVKDELESRERGWAHIERVDGSTEVVRTPVVEKEYTQFEVWTGSPEQPDSGKLVYFGPRGGIKAEPVGFSKL